MNVFTETYNNTGGNPFLLTLWITSMYACDHIMTMVIFFYWVIFQINLSAYSVNKRGKNVPYI